MKNKKYIYVIEENIKTAKMFELKTFISNDKYIRFNQDSLKNFLSKKCFDELLKKGLFMTKIPRMYNAVISLQRLIGCLYSNITDMEMHHINKDKLNNKLDNLVPLEKELNISIDSLPFEEMLKVGQNRHQEWVKEFNKSSRHTLANNDFLIFEILSNSIGKTAKAVHKIFIDKIKSIKIIYEILNKYFYTEDFLKYLKDSDINVCDN